MMDGLRWRQRCALVIWGFFAAAFGGWLYEEICVLVLYHDIYKRGMLHLAICPIYGFGAWGLYLLLHKIKRSLLYCLLSVVIASGFEYICSYLLEFLFHRSFWSYKDWWFSIGDRISLVSSLIFGLLAVLFAKGILPALKRAISKGKEPLWFWCAIAACAVTLVDFVLVAFG